MDNGEDKALENLINQLDKQVRKEADLRILALTLEYRKLAKQVLNAEEMDICAVFFGLLLEDIDAALPPEAAAVFQKLDAQPEIRLLFERLYTLIQAKILTRELEFSPRQVLTPILRGSGYDEDGFIDQLKSRLNKTG